MLPDRNPTHASVQTKLYILCCVAARCQNDIASSCRSPQEFFTSRHRDAVSTLCTLCHAPLFCPALALEELQWQGRAWWEHDDVLVFVGRAIREFSMPKCQEGSAAAQGVAVPSSNSRQPTRSVAQAPWFCKSYRALHIVYVVRAWHAKC